MYYQDFTHFDQLLQRLLCSWPTWLEARDVPIQLSLPTSSWTSSQNSFLALSSTYIHSHKSNAMSILQDGGSEHLHDPNPLFYTWSSVNTCQRWLSSSSQCHENRQAVSSSPPAESPFLSSKVLLTPLLSISPPPHYSANLYIGFFQLLSSVIMASCPHQLFPQGSLFQLNTTSSSCHVFSSDQLLIRPCSLSIGKRT